MKSILIIWIIAMMFWIGKPYLTCTEMDISGYLFDLSLLKKTDLFTTNQTNKILNFTFCEPVTCIASGKKSFVTSASNPCDLYTNSNNPLQQNYTLIDQKVPKKGVRINFLPYSDASTNNTRYVRLNIYCPQSTSQTMSNCVYSQQGTNQIYDCNYQSNAGCASLKLNHFWQFLSDNKIIFAIILWIVALFELLFGYLAIRITIFVFGMFTGTLFGIIFNAQNYEDFIYESQGYGIAVFVICLSFLMGILFGISLLTMPKLGYINIGLWVAIIFSLLLQNAVYYVTGSLLAFYITVGVMALIMTGIALMAFKNYIIISTSFVSSFWLIRPLGFFLSSYPNELIYGQTYLLNNKTTWQFYLYLGAIIILTILGSVFQYCCFKKSKQGNEAYYLQEEGTLKQKFKKLLQFQQIRGLIRNGTNELKLLKKLVVDNQQQQIQYQQSRQQKSNRKLSIDSDQGRKKTKLQKQLTQYNKKQKSKPEKKARMVYFDKSNQTPKVSAKQIQFSQQEDEEEKYVKPNKLVNKKKR